MKKVHLSFLFVITIPKASYAIGKGKLFIDAEKMLQSERALVAYGAIAGIVLGFLIAKAIKPSRKKSSRGVNIPARQNSTSEPSHFSEVTKDLERENAELKTELKNARMERDEFKRRLAETEYLLNKPQAEQKHQPRNSGIQTLYYLQPTTEGLFKVSGNVNHASEALYQLTCNTATEATVRFVDTIDNVSYAVQNEATWILSACERNNIATANTYSIRTDIPGKAILKGEDWEIIQKARITYVE